jgi:hypothetical protein
MSRDDLLTSEGLIEVLAMWYSYERQYNPVAGYPPECPSTNGYRTSRQHDDLNGAAETDERGKLAERVGAVVGEMPEPEKSALYYLARNRATGQAVLRSPRLPADDVERAMVVSRALDLFGAML